MKKSLILIAVAMVAALTVVSCKNNRKAQSQQPTQEEIQEMKQALADSVLAKIDEYAERLFVASDGTMQFHKLELTEEEKIVKPDYLLDPSFASTLVTKSQKVNALAIYLTEYEIRRSYDMPLDEIKEVIAKLAVELNFSFDFKSIKKDTPVSELIKEQYNNLKERGDLAYFWQFQFATLTESSYILANTDVIFNKMSANEERALDECWQVLHKSIEELAQYDEEMSMVNDCWKKTVIEQSEEDKAVKFANLESVKQTLTDNKDILIARRNALLQ